MSQINVQRKAAKMIKCLEAAIYEERLAGTGYNWYSEKKDQG